MTTKPIIQQAHTQLTVKKHSLKDKTISSNHENNIFMLVQTPNYYSTFFSTEKKQKESSTPLQ